MAKALLGRVVAPHTQGASEAWLGILALLMLFALFGPLL